ncbi:FAD-dependent oxidoreductase [Anaeromicrobium sp.]|jgi:urocanate reductase|uniref:FAD-dependent oxidoreductase n=1 Tax=Anaeromicrobium sp. TaxID=1929132 RepID=UPI0025CFFEB0|nr:flavocytochrome c [Anaeromicrobium sp.]
MNKIKRALVLIVALMMAISVIGCSGKTEKADATSQASPTRDEAGLYKLPVVDPKPEKETEQTYDVVVIGAGGAGFSAAIEAASQGAKVVILEQESVVGGNTSLSGAGFNIPENWVQKSQGIEDSVALFKGDTMKGGDSKSIEPLVDVLVNRALPTAQWLRDTVGVEIMDDFQKHFGGHTVARALVVKGGVGSQMVYKMYEKAYELGVKIKVNTKAEELITDESGRVIGVKASNKSGQELVFKGTKGVIVAAGGFAGNVEMRMKYRPDLNETVKTTNAPGHEGSGIVMAQKLGAGTEQMEYIQTYPFCFPTTGKIAFVADTRMYGAPMVNIEGKRFINENDRRDMVSKAILSQSDSFGYMVWDKKIMEEARTLEIYKGEYDKLVADKLLIEANTLEEAADFFGIHKEALATTIKDYNSYAEDFITNGTDIKVADKEFHRNAKMAKVENGPFYIQKVIPGVHHTMGGLAIDTEARVLTIDGKVIKGLYAAGEVVGGIHGTNRLGGNALTDITVFGKLAGETIIKDTK